MEMWPRGKATDFDSVNVGSNPAISASAAKRMGFSSQKTGHDGCAGTTALRIRAGEDPAIRHHGVATAPLPSKQIGRVRIPLVTPAQNRAQYFTFQGKGGNVLLEIMMEGCAILPDGAKSRDPSVLVNRPGCMTDWYTSGFE